MTLSVIILCGGKGTRIKSVLGPIPKVLAPIGDKAFIDYLFKWIESCLISIKHNIILSTCVGHESIQKYVDDKYYMKQAMQLMTQTFKRKRPARDTRCSN